MRVIIALLWCSGVTAFRPNLVGQNGQLLQCNKLRLGIVPPQQAAPRAALQRKRALAVLEAAALVTPQSSAVASEAFASLPARRPEDAASFECNIPELKSVCQGDEECVVGESVYEGIQEWLASADAEHINFAERGRRIFRYDAKADAISMDYYAPDGALTTQSWPWHESFYALYDWDMMC
mmetsp:Transcript_1110/g.3320  ORF Transcript_1110/g.3320 Transcript_1110/m.3320 type:complete len:181 (-) Transcript_1110:56-598(-)